MTPKMMMFANPTRFFSLVFLLMLWSVTGISQANYVLSANPVFTVAGGSSLHDWSMTSKAGTGEGQFVIEGGQFKSAKSLTVKFPAETLKSGSKGLNINAYKALNTEENKEIKFVLKEMTGNGNAFIVKGDLTIAGVTKSVSFPVKLSSAANQLTFEGSLETKLTTFSVTPPTALLGTVKTHDEIKISFKSTFQPAL